MASNFIPPPHPAASPVAELLSILGAAGERAARQAAGGVSERRKGHVRLPGPSKTVPGESLTPMWDVLAEAVCGELQARGARTRLARHLGLPPQRISDFLQSRRLPDGEIALRILHWLAETRAGRDPCLLVPSASRVSPSAALGSDATA